MSKSNHQEFIKAVDGGCLLFRGTNHPITEYDVLRYNRKPYTPDSIQSVSGEIRNLLKADETLPFRERRFISSDIKKKYPENHQRWNRPLFGYCVPAAFSLLYLIDTESLHPIRGTDAEGENHWWLQDMDTGERYDPTSEQYSESELEFVYESGKPNRLYGFDGRPQKRFLTLISMTQPDSHLYKTEDLDYEPPFLG